MGKKLCKIDQLGLSDAVQTLVATGQYSRKEIAEHLRSKHGIKISNATVGRYLARIKSSAGSKAFQIISDHVDKVVPEDLKALEAMEALTYKWATEAAALPSTRGVCSCGQNSPIGRSDLVNRYIGLCRNCCRPAASLENFRPCLWQSVSMRPR